MRNRKSVSNGSPLNGIRVLEISHAIAGPTTSQMLADYGAEVIKIERPEGGDMFRDTPGMGPSMFLSVNRGKRSVVIDLKQESGLKLFYELVRVSDVVIENMGPHVAEGLGITFRKIKLANPRAIYCQIESFGKGPYENIPAFDPVIQAATGIMSTTGFPPDKYVRAGISIVDISAGLHAVSGILVLLYRRNITNKGGELKVSLYDAASYYMAYWIILYELFKKNTSPLGTTHIFGAPYNLFKTKDGFVYIAVASNSAWSSFCASLGFPDLMKNKKYATNALRVKNKKGLENIISNRLGKLGYSKVIELLKNSGVPVAKLNTVKSLLQDLHFLGSGLLREYEYSGKKFRTVVNPTMIDGSRRYTERNPPILGTDTVSVLKSLLHLDANEIRNLTKTGVIVNKTARSLA